MGDAPKVILGVQHLKMLHSNKQQLLDWRLFNIDKHSSLLLEIENYNRETSIRYGLDHIDLLY